MSEPLVVLFEDEHCLVVAKPAGLLTQARGKPIPGELTLEAAVRRYLHPDAPETVYLGTVHRLDRPVSGVVVWAKSRRAARRLSNQFAGRMARKEYWAIVAGDASHLADVGLWDDWLTAPERTGAVRLVAPNTPAARQAITGYRKGARARLPDGMHWLILRPETGRTHQLRAQAAARGLPIVGDAVYGSETTFPEGIALHARSLSVLHPILRTPATWVTPVPLAWRARGILLSETEVFDG